MAKTSRSLLKSAGRTRAELAGVGIGLPGPVEHSTGRPVLPPIMPGWDNYDVPGHVMAALGGPVLVDNDVNIMALGEHATMYPHIEQMLFVKVATGIGAGIISGGRLHRGAQGTAGDLGHVAALHGGDTRCTCGNLGCLEAVASGPAIVRALRERGVELQDSSDLIRLAKAGDLAAATAIRDAGREIGHVLATCVSLLNPSVIVVGGRLAQSAESLLAGIREVVYGRSLPLATGDLQIVASRTAGHAGVIGAATMVVQHRVVQRLGVHELGVGHPDEAEDGAQVGLLAIVSSIVGSVVVDRSSSWTVRSGRTLARWPRKAREKGRVWECSPRGVAITCRIFMGWRSGVTRTRRPDR